jgi:hypothetical protein
LFWIEYTDCESNNNGGFYLRNGMLQSGLQ